MTYDVRRLGSEHAAAACAASQVIVGKSASLDSMRDALAGELLFLVAYDADEPVGFVYGHALPRVTRDGSAMLLYEIEVRDRWRRQGVGRALVRAFDETARGAGADSVWLLTNESTPGALAFYVACGYTRRHDDDAMFVRDFR